MQHLIVIRDIIQKILDDEDERIWHWSLCQIVNQRLIEADYRDTAKSLHQILLPFFKTWSKRDNKYESYPVPCPIGGCPADAFDDAEVEATMWLGEYGELRLDLCRHIVNELNKCIEKVEDLQQVMDACIKVLKDQRYCSVTRSQGTCFNVYDNVTLIYSTLDRILYKMFKTWKYYSGCPSYPIPSTNSGLTPAAMYESLSGNFWEGEQGVYRKSLCEHILKELDEYIEENWGNK